MFSPHLICNNNRYSNNIQLGVVHNCCNTGIICARSVCQPQAARMPRPKRGSCCYSKSVCSSKGCKHSPQLLNSSSCIGYENNFSQFPCSRTQECCNDTCWLPPRSRDFQDSYKCNYPCFKCFRIKHESQSETVHSCTNSCPKCDNMLSPVGDNQRLANNCSRCSDSLYLQLVPTVAGSVESDLPLVVLPFPYVASGIQNA